MRNLNDLIEYAQKRENDDVDSEEGAESEIQKQRKMLDSLQKKRKLDELAAKKKNQRRIKEIRKTRASHKFTMTQWTSDDNPNQEEVEEELNLKKPAATPKKKLSDSDDEVEDEDSSLNNNDDSDQSVGAVAKLRVARSRVARSPVAKSPVAKSPVLTTPITKKEDGSDSSVIATKVVAKVTDEKSIKTESHLNHTKMVTFDSKTIIDKILKDPGTCPMCNSPSELCHEKVFGGYSYAYAYHDYMSSPMSWSKSKCTSAFTRAYN